MDKEYLIKIIEENKENPQLFSFFASVLENNRELIPSFLKLFGPKTSTEDTYCSIYESIVVEYYVDGPDYDPEVICDTYYLSKFFEDMHRDLEEDKVLPEVIIQALIRIAETEVNYYYNEKFDHFNMVEVYAEDDTSISEALEEGFILLIKRLAIKLDVSCSDISKMIFANPKSVQAKGLLRSISYEISD